MIHDLKFVLESLLNFFKIFERPRDILYFISLLVLFVIVFFTAQVYTDDYLQIALVMAGLSIASAVTFQASKKNREKRALDFFTAARLFLFAFGFIALLNFIRNLSFPYINEFVAVLFALFFTGAVMFLFIGVNQFVETDFGKYLTITRKRKKYPLRKVLAFGSIISIMLYKIILWLS